jgi:hypothetical protein
MERKEFLKRAGLGSAALASFPALTEAALAQGGRGRRRFHFVALSGVAPTLTGGDGIVMAGRGTFTRSEAEGLGDFVHFDGTKIPSTDFIATGKWTVGRLLSFEQVGAWGTLVAGIAEFRIRLRPCEGPSRRATLKVVCNIGPAGIITDPFQQEGFTLTLPGGVTFSPFTPNIGLTVFTRGCPS